MALTKLIVGGLKSLKDPVEIPLAPITFLFGPNSAGKSVVRDALFELKRRLSVERVHDGFGAGIARMVGRDAMAHQLPRPDELDEATSVGVLLGCEVDAFAPNGRTTLSEQNEWAELGTELYWKLKDKLVRYQFVDAAGDWSCLHELTVDGDLVVSHFVPEIAEGRDTWPELPPRGGAPGVPAGELGLLRVNLGHAVTAVPEFQALAQRLLQVSGQLGSKWAGRVAWLADSILHVRVDAYRRRVQNWADSTPDQYGTTANVPDDATELEAPLGALCFAINELIQQFEWSLAQDIEIAHVSGSRTLLTEQQVSTEWFTVRTYLPESYAGHTLIDYAKWLGATSIDADELGIRLDDETKGQDDFVNDVLAAHLFAARRYRVKAEVSTREETMIAPRDATWSTEPELSMKSTLFLLDDQGRVLDFSQVGSGISYVLPALAALWGAERSLIEQPELHLHPAAQCEMGDVVIRAFNRGRFSIIETHSEHLLLRVLRRIRQTPRDQNLEPELRCLPEAVAVLYFSAAENGTTLVSQLRVSRSGDFMDRWPDGFFEERSRELFDE